MNTAGMFYAAVTALGGAARARGLVPWSNFTGSVEVWRTARPAAMQAMLDRIPATAAVTLVTQPDDKTAYRRAGLAVAHFPRPGSLAADEATLAWAAGRGAGVLLVPVNNSAESGYAAVEQLARRRGGDIWFVHGEYGRRVDGATVRPGLLSGLLDLWRGYEEARARAEMVSFEQPDPAKLERSTERIRPLWQWHVLFQEHMARYRRAAASVAGLNVLDIGCGEGYGADQLAAAARLVVAVDVSPAAMKFAAKKYRRANLFFAVADARRLPFRPGVFARAVSFEVIEHLPEPEVFLRETQRVLAPDGELAFSTPNRATYPPGNIYHLREYTLTELRDLLPRCYREVSIESQRGNARYREWYRRLAEQYGMRDTYSVATRRLGWPPPDEEFCNAIIRRAQRAQTGFDEGKLTPADFIFSGENLEQADYFYCTCRVGGFSGRG
ncbi:MAG: hypothetical protein A2107_13625 [Verrucomicrobia bacterium GWF2_62_7]|nr:MAG: hypothetical protein A2107_13625 [Verrucomicrobia bacterium GWF2_62_7]